MTLMEAMTSGKLFRRPDHMLWMRYEGGEIRFEDGGAVPFGPTIDDLDYKDLLAGDWITKPKKLTMEYDLFKQVLSEIPIQDRDIDTMWEVLESYILEK